MFWKGDMSVWCPPFVHSRQDLSHNAQRDCCIFSEKCRFFRCRPHCPGGEECPDVVLHFDSLSVVVRWGGVLRMSSIGWHLCYTYHTFRRVDCDPRPLHDLPLSCVFPQIDSSVKSELPTHFAVRRVEEEVRVCVSHHDESPVRQYCIAPSWDVDVSVTIPLSSELVCCGPSWSFQVALGPILSVFPENMSTNGGELVKHTSPPQRRVLASTVIWTFGLPVAVVGLENPVDRTSRVAPARGVHSPSLAGLLLCWPNCPWDRLALDRIVQRLHQEWPAT